jgi:ElaB/YqjD/DUF883 family membrane-anchored ribosome-binding protein
MTANQTETDPTSSTDTLKDRTGKIVDGMQDRFREAGEDVRHGAEKASAEIKRGYERASQAAREGYDRVEKDLQSLTRDLNAYVRDNPGKSVILAAGVGFLLGFLMRSEDD